MKRAFGTIRVLYLAAALMFGGSAGTDILVDEKADYQVLVNPDQPQQPGRERESFEAAAKGAVSLLSLALFTYTSKREGQRRVVHVSVQLPWHVDDVEAPELVGKALDRHKSDFIRLLRHKIAIGSLELFSIDDLRFSYLNEFLTVSMTVSFQDFGAWEDLKDTLISGIVDHCQKLFQEKLIRISKRMGGPDASLDRSVDDVVSEQLREISR